MDRVKSPFGNRSGDIRDGAHLSSQVRGELVHVVRKVAPDSGRAGHQRLAAQLAFYADFAGHVAHLVGEHRQSVDHAVDRVGEFGDFAFRLQHQFALQISVGDVGDDFRDTANLSGEIRSHGVDVIRQILPRTGRRRAPPPGRRAFLPCRLRAPRGSLPTRNC